MARRFLALIGLMFLLGKLWSINLGKIDSLRTEILLATNDSLRFELYLDLVTIYIFNNPVEGEKLSKKALELAKKKKWDEKIAEAHIYYAHTTTAQSKYSYAIESLIESFNLAEKVGNYDLMAYSGTNLIRTFTLVNNPDLAIQYSRKVLAAVEKLRPTYSIEEYNNRKGSVYISMGEIYQAKNKLDTATYYFKESIKLTNWNNKTEKIRNFTALGKIYQEQNDFKNAAIYLLKANELALEGNKKNWICKTQSHLGELYYKLEKKDSSLVFLENSIKIAHELEIPQVVLNSYLVLSQIFEDKGDYQKSLSYYKKYKAYNDVVINNKALKEYAILQERAKYEEEKKLLAKEQKVKEYKLFIALVLTVSTLVLFIFLFNIQRLKSRKRQLEKQQLTADNDLLNKDLLMVNQELTSKVMYMIKRNKLIEEVTERLLHLKYNLKKENVKVVVELISDLQRANDDGIWKEFDNRFSSIHPSFYKTLSEQYPDITMNDKRLCAYINMNLSSKEIAYFTGIQPNSISVARTRLRKKLNLTNSNVSLEEFLSNF